MNKKQIQELRSLIAEIEGRTILFDSDNWPRYQQTCVEWGDKVAPFLETEEKKKFNSELDTIRAVIHQPFLPSDFSGAPKEGAFNKMKGLAKQKLQELEKDLTQNDTSDDAIHLPSKVTVFWLLKLIRRMSIGSWSSILFLLGVSFSIGYQLGQLDFRRIITTFQNQQRSQSIPAKQAIMTTAKRVNNTLAPTKKDTMAK